MLSSLVASSSAAVVPSCPPGFERPSDQLTCYLFAAGPSTKGAAEAYCASFRATLACPSTAEAIDYIGQRAIADHRSYWLGLSDVAREGEWTWPGTCAMSSPANISSLPWCPGEPNNGGGGSRRGGTADGGDCVRVVRVGEACPAGSWADYRCDASHGTQSSLHGSTPDLHEFGFVCELSPSKLRVYDASFLDVQGGSGSLGGGKLEALPVALPAATGNSGDGGGGGVAVAWPALLALALITSTVGNAYLLLRWRRDGMSSRPHSTGSAADRIIGVDGNELASSYEAPLRPLGSVDSTSSTTGGLGVDRFGSCTDGTVV